MWVQLPRRPPMTEKEKFTNYIKERMEKGLLDIHVAWISQAMNVNEEELFAELNRMIEAPTVPDPEVLGKYSP
jgi:hypothetical protein